MKYRTGKSCVDVGRQEWSVSHEQPLLAHAVKQVSHLQALGGGGVDSRYLLLMYFRLLCIFQAQYMHSKEAVVIGYCVAATAQKPFHITKLKKLLIKYKQIYFSLLLFHAYVNILEAEDSGAAIPAVTFPEEVSYLQRITGFMRTS